VKVAAVIPVKALGAAKSRLRGALSADQRAALALWLLERVMGAVVASGAVDEVAVVSPDRMALELAMQVAARPPGHGRPDAAPDSGVEDVPDKTPTIMPLWQERGDLNAGLDLGLRWALAGRAGGLLVLLGDLPSLQPDEVREMVDLGVDLAGRMRGQGKRGVAVLAPDRAGTGTNGLFVAPAGAMPFAFGAQSRSRHEALARGHGLAAIAYLSLGTSFDVDRPEDLDELRAGGAWPGEGAQGGGARMREG
jgi:2-phospho-L-lactate/phosphoenolpyruvate guanylyltransferase